MAAAGKYGHYLGEVTLTIEQHQVIAKEAMLHPSTHCPLSKHTLMRKVRHC